MTVSTVQFLFVAGLLSASGLPAPSYAQQEQTTDEIIVVERRVEESIPLDLSRFGSRLEIITIEEIEKQGYTDIGQSLQRLIPGLFIAPKNGPFDYFSGSLQGSRSQDIELATLEKIDELYPTDNAVNYSMGELRGLWKVEYE